MIEDLFLFLNPPFDLISNDFPAIYILLLASIGGLVLGFSFGTIGDLSINNTTGIAGAICGFLSAFWFTSWVLFLNIWFKNAWICLIGAQIALLLTIAIILRINDYAAEKDAEKYK